jgi:hypothetical protein
VDDLAGVAVVYEAHVAQSLQMVLNGLELPDPDAGEGRVLAVGPKEPLVVGEASPKEAHLGQFAFRSRIVLAGVGLPDLQVLRYLHRVGEVLLAPVYGLLQALVAGQTELSVLLQGEPIRDLLLKQGFRVRQHCCVLGESRFLRAAWHRTACGTVYVGTCDREPHGLGLAGGKAHLVPKLSARARAVLRVVAARRSLWRVRPRSRANDGWVLRSPVGLARLTPGQGQVRADHGGPVVGQGVVGRRGALLPEDEVITLDGDGVFEVEGRLARVRLSPRICAHQLGVGVHLEGEVLVRSSGFESEADEDRALAIGDEVRAAYAHASLARQFHLHVTVAAGELCSGPDPLLAYTEPDPIQKLDRGAPDAPHLAAGVEAHRRVASCFRAYDIGPIPRRHVAPFVEPIRDR